MVGILDIKGQDQCRRVYGVDGIAPTLTTSEGGQRQVKIFDPKRLRVRKLTPYEYGILQTFPMANGWKQVVSDSQAYKQFGNAVTVSLFTAIATAVKEAILKETEESEELNMEEIKTENAEGKEIEIGMNPLDTEKREDSDEYENTEGNYINIENLGLAIARKLNNEELIPGVLINDIHKAIEEYLTDFKGKVIGEPSEEQRDWNLAKKALEDELEEYAKLGPAGLYGIKALTPLKARLDQGERTPDLFNTIVAIR